MGLTLFLRTVRHRTYSVALAICLASGSLLAGEEAESRPSQGSGGELGMRSAVKIDVDGTEREYRIFVPKHDAGDALPLVIAFHGFLIDSKDVMPLYTKLPALAAKEKFVLVFPNAIDARWRIGGLDKPEPDIALFDALYDRLSKEYNIDLSRVYLVGMSNGGYFSHVLAARRSDKIAAIATHSSGLGWLAVWGIKAKRKYPVLVIHGVDDKIVPLSQGEETRDRYRKEKHPVEMVTVEGLGHFWASSDGINAKIWTFFEEHPLVASDDEVRP